MTESKIQLPARNFGREIWDMLRILAVSLLIVIPFRYFVAQPFIVRGASMEPNFSNGEYLIIDEISYRFQEPKRGEAIVFRYPRDPRQFFIKRIVGLPGEEVALENGRVRIISSSYPEGFTLEESYLSPPDHLTRPDVHVRLGEGEYFVLGDNRDFSSDSRIWGTLPRRLIIGRTVFRVLPFPRLGFIAHPLNY